MTIKIHYIVVSVTILPQYAVPECRPGGVWLEHKTTKKQEMHVFKEIKEDQEMLAVKKSMY